MPKIPNQMHEKCMKTWNKMQKEGHKGLTGLERGKPCKNFEGKRQKILSGALPNRRERGKFEKIWKSDFEKVTLKKSNLTF